MEWLNIHVSTLRSPEFIGSTPVERATWLCVLGYCVEQENGGRIVCGSEWKDRQWQQACGVTLREVRLADKLLTTDDTDLLVNGYPAEKEKQVRQARGVAMSGAMARWGKSNAEKMPVGNAEGKGREGNKKGRTTEASADEMLFDPESMKKAQDIMTADAKTKPPGLPTAAPPKSFADWRAMHAHVYIGKDERQDWQALYQAYGWDPMSAGHKEILEKSADKNLKIFLNVMTKWLSDNFTLED